MNFYFDKPQNLKPDHLTSCGHCANIPSLASIKRYIQLYNEHILLNQPLSLRGARYVAEVVMQASIMEDNNLVDVSSLYSFGYLQSGGILLTEYTTSIERTLYSIQHGYFFEHPVLNNLDGVEMFEDGADTILAWTSSCIPKLNVAFSKMGSRSPVIESLNLDGSIIKRDHNSSNRVIMLLTTMPDFSHVTTANRFIDVCLNFGVKPIVTLHPTERNLKCMFMYANQLRFKFRYLSFKDSREFFGDRYIISNGSSLLFFAFINDAKVGYWDHSTPPITGRPYHFVDEHINNKATLKKFLTEGKVSV